MTRRSILTIAALVTMLTVALAAPVSAAAGIHYQVVDNVCSASVFQTQLKIIKDQGVTGVTRFTMDATLQQFKGGKWKVATPNFTPESKTVSSGAAKAKWTYGFGKYGPFTYRYRIVTLLQAWAGNTITWHATNTSPTCGPT